jgi:hypothetical protein
VRYTVQLTLTRGFVENFRRREVDALMARELPSLRGVYIGTRAVVYWFYLMVVASAVALLAAAVHFYPRNDGNI